ncbi:MAG: AAA family ATPase, partial [Candidatus Nanopelagicaceae bacterium]
KTEMIEQICAKLNRECLRVNFTEMTDEDSLIGTWRLVNRDGNSTMEWQDGPVIVALKRGAVLLLDEMDCGTAKTMCLQSPLEGKGKFIDRIIEKIPNSLRFNIVATCNTKGKGSDDGRFVGTRVMNEAFLDRFDYTYEQDYAPRSTEKKILVKSMKKFGIDDASFADNLTKWSEMQRVLYREGGVDEIISTRRLLNICKAYAVFGDKAKSLRMGLARFDETHSKSFFDSYMKIDAEASEAEAKARNAEAGVDAGQAPWSDIDAKYAAENNGQ